jgi:hypothetical protein
MAKIFAPVKARSTMPKGMAGAFNRTVATRLSMGTDGEGSIY